MIYINGVNVASGSDSRPIPDPATPFQIGTAEPENPGRTFNGLIDDVRIYKQALSDSKIQVLFYDADGDGILDDGDGSGTIGDNYCTGTGDPDYPDCDDNCPNDPNTDQADADSDGVGDVCDLDMFHPYDIDQDWAIGDFELLNATDDWAGGSLGDFELLYLVEFWVAGCYQWDAVTGTHQVGC